MRNKPITNHLTCGAIQLSQAIEEAKEVMFNAPWLKRSDNLEQEKAAADSQLKHQLSAALDQGFVTHDPLYPEFCSLDQHNQFGLVNPDNRYNFTTISASGTYLIRGKRGTSADLQIQVGGGNPGFNEDETSPDTVDQMSLEGLAVDENGNFEITISDTDTGGNWLSNFKGKGKDRVEATSVLIRESFMDWENETSGTWYIERIDTRGTVSPLPDSARVNEQYKRASEYLVESTKGWVKFVTGLKRKLRLNTLIEPIETKAGLPGQWNSAGLFEIKPSEAVIISVPASPARYQSIQIGDQWFHSFDFCRRQTSLTASQARLGDDNCYWFVISSEDPGVANWLDPVTASKIFVFIRWQGLPEHYQFSADPCAKIVSFNELHKHLPNEPAFSPEQRVEQLAARHFASLSKPRGF